MSKERLEEITQMINSFDDSSFSATLYGYEMDSKALISDFVFLLNHIKNQQAEIDTLSMAHDDMHRLLPKDKHFLIKSNINLNRKVQELEKENSDYWHENDTLHKSVDYLHEQNKHYREVIKAIEKYANDCIDVEVEMNPYLVIDDIKALEGEE